MLTIFVDYGHICRLWYTYTLFDGLAYNTCGYFTSCVVFSEPRRGEEKYEQWAKYPLVLYAKPSNKRFIIPLHKKNCYFTFGFYFSGKSIQKHPDSVCENDVNIEQNDRGYYMSNHWTRGWLLYFKEKIYLGNKRSSSLKEVKSKGPKQVKIRFIPRFVQFSPNCSFMRRFSPCCKPVKVGHYVFCAFSWPYMVKWHNSGIIMAHIP